MWQYISKSVAIYAQVSVNIDKDAMALKVYKLYF